MTLSMNNFLSPGHGKLCGLEEIDQNIAFLEKKF